MQAVVRGYLARRAVYEEICRIQQFQDQYVARASDPKRFGVEADISMFADEECVFSYDRDVADTGKQRLTEIEEEGEYEFKNGSVYKGQWHGNQRHGYGSQKWPDGAKYEGEWKDNQAHGKGTFYHVDGDMYEGDWRHDKANGYGIYLHANGARYEGNWINDLQEGFGVETWVDGSKYEGYYV